MISFEARVLEINRRFSNWKPAPIHKVFFEMSERYMDRDYVLDPNRSWTYGQISKLSKALAAGLLKLGLKPREQVAVNMPNYAEFVISTYAISAAAGVAVPLNYKLKKNELKYLIQQSESGFLITLDYWKNIDYLAIIQELCPEVFEGKPSEQFPYLKKIVVFSPDGKKYPGTTDFYDLIQMCEEQEFSALLTKAAEHSKYVDNTADIMYTSGTTSLPKGVLMTHDMFWRSAVGSLLNRGYQDGRSIFVPIPLYHVFGYVEGVLAAALVGGSIVLQVNFDEGEALDLIERYEVFDVLCVPTIGLRMLEEQRKNPRNVSSLKAMYCAGGEVSAELWKGMKKEFVLDELNTGYGMTECTGGVMQTCPTDDIEYLIKYVGKIIPGGNLGLPDLNGNCIEYRVIDKDSGEFIGPGIQGELVCRGPMVTRGYFKKPIETAAAIDKDGWLRTGDLGVIHENGYVSLTGRSKELYRVGAENVSPKEIEDIYNGHPKVSQSFVVGVPDEVMGEAGVAWIVLKSGQSATKEEMIQYGYQNLAKFKVPKYIRFVTLNELPTTLTGKIQKFKLREIFAQTFERSQV